MTTPYEVSDDPARLDLDAVHRALAETYWARGRSRHVVARDLAASWCVGAYELDGGQVGFARLARGGEEWAWLCDVYVLPAHRRRGLGGRLTAAAVERAAADGVQRLLLATRDAHALYRRHGFAGPEGGLFMELAPGVAAR